MNEFLTKVFRRRMGRVHGNYLEKFFCQNRGVFSTFFKIIHTAQVDRKYIMFDVNFVKKGLVG